MWMLNGAWLEEPLGSRLDDRGWTLADGCFETVRIAGGRPLWLDDHLARLAVGLRTLRLPDVTASLRNEAEAMAMRCDHGLLRMQVTRGPGARGLAPPPNAEPTRALSLTPGAPLAAEPSVLRGWVARGTRRNEHSPLCRFKALATYADQILALIEAHEAGYDEALVLNTAGAPACWSAGNLWAVLDGVAVTPPLATGALPGVVRARLLTSPLPTAERALRLEELATAEELWLSNVGRGVAAVTALDGAAVGSGRAGPLAQAAQAWLSGQLG